MYNRICADRSARMEPSHLYTMAVSEKRCVGQPFIVELSFLEPDRIGQEIAFHRFNGKSTLQAHAGGCTHPGIIRVD
jgi:hypothetical protein